MIAAALAAASTAAAQDSYEHGRIRYVEAGTLIQRATETGTEEALPNLPFLPGDRIWTTDSGRAEFEFPARRLVRLDVRSKLDYVTHEDSEEQGEFNVLRLWSGAVFVHFLDERGAAGLEIETPGGLVSVGERAVLRIDVAAGETGLSVYAGSALIDSGRERQTVEAGERTRARFGEVDRPESFDAGEMDAFARWDSDREAQESYRAANAPPELPEEVAPYAAELEPYGSWQVEVGVGNVWVPQVGPGWAPYLNGRWAWTPYGWTWVPYDPWGWAPFHYGSWGFSVGLGWYWAPGSHWAPARVAWSVGGGYVGWCPIGPHGRPVVVPSHGRRGDYAVPRGAAGASPWVYTRQGDLAARDVARRRVSLGEREVAGLRVLDSPERGHVDRNVRAVEGRAVPRHVSTRPTPGDTIDELRSDPATTIPFPTPRRRYPSEAERQRQADPNQTSRQRSPWLSQGSQPAPTGEPRAVRRRGSEPSAAQPSEVTTGQVSRRAPSGWSTPASGGSGATTRSAPDDSRSRGGSSSGTSLRNQDRQRTESPERQILRRMFGSLGDRGSSASSRGSSTSSRGSSASSNDRGRDRGTSGRQTGASSNDRNRSRGSSIGSTRSQGSAQGRQPRPSAPPSGKQGGQGARPRDKNHN